VEDNAYCLTGLFDINMHPMYGEGERAFVRLQLETPKTSDDESIFAWVVNEQTGRYQRGLLAMSPLAFKDSGDVIRCQGVDTCRPPYSMTNKGLRVEYLLYNQNSSMPFLGKSGLDGPVLAPLNCVREDTGDFIALYLVPGRVDTYIRHRTSELILISLLQPGINAMGRKILYVEGDVKGFSRNQAPRIAKFSIQADSMVENGVYISEHIFHQQRLHFFPSRPQLRPENCDQEIVTF
jgi:hypothetical protein